MRRLARSLPWLSAAALLAVTALPARAQLVGKVPPAPAPTPEYVPPAPPPPPPPPKPVEPEKPLPSLVKKDDAGRLIRYPEGAERAAIAAFDFDAETRQKIAASEAARAADLERTVVEKFDKALEARATRESLEQIKDFNEFARIKDVAAPLASERLVDRLMRDGAITPPQRTRIDQVIKEYEEALKQEWQGQTGTDILKIASLVAREKFTEVTRDSLDALDRVLLRSAAQLESVRGELNLDAAQAGKVDAAVAAIKAASGSDAAATKARLDAIAALVTSDLTPDQQKLLLSKAIESK
jgi:hypothetical protein